MRELASGWKRDKNPVHIYDPFRSKGEKYSDFRVVMQILGGRERRRLPLLPLPLREYDCRFNGAVRWFERVEGRQEIPCLIASSYFQLRLWIISSWRSRRIFFFREINLAFDLIGLFIGKRPKLKSFVVLEGNFF